MIIDASVYFSRIKRPIREADREMGRYDSCGENEGRSVLMFGLNKETLGDRG